MRNSVTIKGRCRSCNDRINIIVNELDYERFQSGQSVQKCFPYLSADDREFLISETCGECFDKLFNKPY